MADPDDWVEEQAEKPDRLALHRMKQAVRDARKAEKQALKALAAATQRADIALAIAEPQKPTPIQARTSKPREATAFALASDWHIEEEVKPEQVNGRNAYDLAESATRARRFFEGFVWLLQGSIRMGYTIRDAVLWLGGDFLTGRIHEENVETGQLSPTMAILRLQKYLIAGIDYVLEHTELELLRVPCNYGNHGRLTKKRRHATGAENSIEVLLYHSLAQHYAEEPRVEVIVASGSHLYLKVYDYVVRFHHGDDVRYGGGVGGISIPLRKAVFNWDKFEKADLTVIGHYHQWLDLGDVVVNGSLIGYNAYALSLKARFEPPRQGFFLLDKRRGKTMSCPIWVGERS